MSLPFVIVAGTVLILATGSVSAQSIGSRTNPCHKKSLVTTEETHPRQSSVQILSFNDFHGQIAQGKRIAGRPVGSAPILVAYLREEERTFKGTTFIVHAGDLVGASPPQSALLQDEPAIMMLNSIVRKKPAGTFHPAVEFVNVVGIPGNHAFDEGIDELHRLLYGGNHPDGPFLQNPYPGAMFPYVCANVINVSSGRTIFPPYVIGKTYGMDIAFIGATTTETPGLVVPATIRGIGFTSEADAINRTVHELRSNGINAIIVLVHRGGFQHPYEGPTRPEADSISGELPAFIRKLDGNIDVVVCGHTHSFTNAFLPSADGSPILVTQAWSAGTAYCDIELECDTLTRDITSKSARIVTTWADSAFKLVPDSAMAAMVRAAETNVMPLTARIVTTTSIGYSAVQNSAGESTLGNLIADSQRAATGATVAMVNPGGIRSNLEAKTITWGDCFNVLPFRNRLVTMKLSGRQLRALLTKQWQRPMNPRMLQLSGLSYSWDPARPVKSRIIAVTIDGVPLCPDSTYRVTVNSYLAGGGDHFTEFTEGTEQTIGPVDLDAFVDYLKNLSPPLSVPAGGRIRRVH